MRRDSEALQQQVIRSEVLRQLHEALASPDGEIESLSDLALMALCDSSANSAPIEHD